MEEMDRQCKVRDQFRARYQNEEEYDTTGKKEGGQLKRFFFSRFREIERWTTRQLGGRSDCPYAYTYHIKLFNIQTRPSIQPPVTSPRKLRQLRSRSSEISLPATRAVNRMRTLAHA